ncbi:MAG TPA: CTP synthase [Polyangiaceae bacterium]|nr:MAG: CTP synthase [Deltaproteobacteria bacterium ADurb.Bin207]HNS98663.1 CTP synthase [Polyangiaceae bacterium]HNZ23321.1 CTP synthase [Polyangiaceae bacterium]HOD21909.1 CTP synthase [Polyangiaceae bacterium]HOE49354.1 CTP synthase [Polyangiaceae bacterium]
MSNRTKFIFLTGGVVSAIGKGLTGASIGALMEARGLRVTNMKLDPYLNVDPGTMSPIQHGEVFVTDDGTETDLDLGHYERFTQTVASRRSTCSSGSIYEAVLARERQGGYLGATVQVIPHVTDEIKNRIRNAARGYDIAICEIGGTIGDIESLPFLEAIRQMRVELGKENTISIHLTLVPYIAAAGELKTKPTQHSVKEMREIGIQPDILVCRTDRPLDKSIKGKIALFSNVDADCVITAMDVAFIYELPLLLHHEGIDVRITEQLNIWARSPDLEAWKRVCERYKNPTQGTVRIGVVGKYVDLRDSYKSLSEALVHAGLVNDVRVDLEYIASETIDSQNVQQILAGLDGVLVPGGFGERGVRGKIEAIRHAREMRIPFFGICLGMQLAVIEFARNQLKLEDADSTEFNKHTRHAVIDLMPDQRNVTDKGATMRLGAYPCVLKKGTMAAQIYGATEISERHRHRYEFANAYREPMEAAGMVLSGFSPDSRLVEVIELPDHPFFIACQFHPEFRSKVMKAHPLFVNFLQAAMKARTQNDSTQSAAPSNPTNEQA